MWFQLAQCRYTLAFKITEVIHLPLQCNGIQFRNTHLVEIWYCGRESSKRFCEGYVFGCLRNWGIPSKVFWWGAEDAPSFSQRTYGKTVGCDPPFLQGTLNMLSSRGLLTFVLSTWRSPLYCLHEGYMSFRPLRVLLAKCRQKIGRYKAISHKGAPGNVLLAPCGRRNMSILICTCQTAGKSKSGGRG